RGPDGKAPKPPPRPVLAQGRVRYVGEPVAAVIAETYAQAREAAELIQIDYNDLPAAVALADAPQAETIHPEAPGNVLTTWTLGDQGKTDAAFADADHVVAIDLRN